MWNTKWVIISFYLLLIWQLSFSEPFYVLIFILYVNVQFEWQTYVQYAFHDKITKNIEIFDSLTPFRILGFLIVNYMLYYFINWESFCNTRIKPIKVLDKGGLRSAWRYTEILMSEENYCLKSFKLNVCFFFDLWRCWLW